MCSSGHRDLLALRKAWPSHDDGRRDLVEIDLVSDDVLRVRRGRLSLLVVTSARQVPAPTGAVLLASSLSFVAGDEVVEGPGALILDGVTSHDW